jgi:hypothetical protein
MDSLFDTNAKIRIFQRLNSLSHESSPAWGKMNVSQMLAHCSAVMEFASGHTFPPRVFIGRILGPFIRSSYTNDKPWKQNLPTEPGCVIGEQKDFQKELDKLKKMINEFHDGGPSKCTSHPHPFFGKLTTDEWAKGMYKHLDHHLRQFNA